MSTPEKPYFALFAIAKAVGTSSLPQHLRHTILSMMWLANHQTGRGFASQATIGDYMGCSERQVRRNIADLERLSASGASPVVLDRSYRTSSDGRGRTSDLYTLTLAAIEPTGHPRPVEDDGPTGHPRPVEDDQQDTHGRPTGHPRPGIMLVNKLVKKRRDPEFPSSQAQLVPSSDTDSSTSRPVKGNGKPAPVASPNHSALVAHYFSTFKARRGVEPLFDGKDGSAIKRLLKAANGDLERAKTIISNAFGSWNGENVTIQSISYDPSKWLTPSPPKTYGKHAPVQQGLAEGVRIAEFEG